MKRALLDVNVLVSLFDPAHPNHNDAHDWFARERGLGWATCPLTFNGCVRVISNPAYPSFTATTSEVLTRLAALCGAEDHQFWPDDVWLGDLDLFRRTAIQSSRAITDVYLLGLAVKNAGRLVTFDRSIATRAVKGAERGHLEVLGNTK